MEKPFQDPEWQRRLDQMAPPNGKLSWLTCYFEEGYEWEPVGRWMIGQVIPSASIALPIRDLLEGPNPADHGHFEADEYGTRRWVTDLPGVSRRQWHFFQDTGNYLRPYWVVQGTKGGHRYQWTHAERAIIRLNGGNPEPPLPGALCYAIPDERTYNEIAKRDMLKKFVFSVDYMDKQAARARLDDDEKRGLEEMRKHLWDSISDQVGGYASEMEFAMRGDMDMAPQNHEQWDKKLEDLEQSFITEGA